MPSTPRQAQTVVRMDDLRRLLGFPATVRPLFVRACDDQTAIVLTLEGDSLPEPTFVDSARPYVDAPLKVTCTAVLRDGRRATFDGDWNYEQVVAFARDLLAEVAENEEHGSTATPEPDAPTPPAGAPVLVIDASGKLALSESAKSALRASVGAL